MPTLATDHANPDTPVSGLVNALEICQPLLISAGASLRVFPGAATAPGAALDAAAVARCNDVLTALGRACGLRTPQLVWPAPARPTSLEVALSNLCSLEIDSWYAIANAADRPLPARARRVLGSEPAPRVIEVPGLPRFATFARGPATTEAIVVIPPCGVPAALFQPWLTALSARCRVVTYENPYLFGGWAALPLPSGEIAVEAAYVAAIMHAYGITRAHLIGICGGAPIAVVAAAELGTDVASLIICHGDLNFGAHVPRTPFQAQFQGLLAEARTSLQRARETLELFLDPNILFGVPVRLAPFILYPYGNVELYYRYARINHGLMTHDISEAARRLAQRALIVSSRTDRMTHPAASHHLHGIVRGSTLAERAAGTHHDILLPGQDLFSLLSGFIAASDPAHHGGRE